MQNSGACCHPLGIAISDCSTAPMIVTVIEDSIDNVGDSFKSSVWVPWSSFGFTGCIFDFAHLIEMNKWIKICKINTGECAAYWKTFTFKSLRCGRYRFNAAYLARRVCDYAGQDGYIAHCYCWHVGSFYSGILIVDESS